jgi:fucose permease
VILYGVAKMLSATALLATVGILAARALLVVDAPSGLPRWRKFTQVPVAAVFAFGIFMALCFRTAQIGTLSLDHSRAPAAASRSLWILTFAF